MKASIALQVLPLSQGIDRIALIDQVIAYLQAQGVSMVVTPFETVLEGDFDQLMRILKEALEVAGQEADNVFANVKINIGEILSRIFGYLVSLAVSGIVKTPTKVYLADTT